MLHLAGTVGATVVAASVAAVHGIVGHVEQSVEAFVVTLGQLHAGVAPVSGVCVVSATGACVVRSAASTIG